MCKPRIKKQCRENDRRCKLTDEDIADIRLLVRSGEFSYTDLSKLFGVSRTTIFKWAKERNHQKANSHQLSYYHRTWKKKISECPQKRDRIRKNIRVYHHRHKDKLNDYHRKLGQYYRDKENQVT